ncbi:MAG: CHAT domain-containing protein, partial [Oscillatoriales cyanobacterium SM2_1_8]|nr:CHAT domain-containing protein [Oscillatoriales cyanobacterium SM2_1_8]
APSPEARRLDRFWLPSLPFAQQEIENLLTLFPNRSTSLWNRDLQPESLLAQAPAYNTVHLATHALFQPGRPEDSFILFGNGRRQTLADVRTWQLAIDLLVLSACETASGGLTGQGEEILGFGYLMAQAGVRTSIASLWAVDDGGTQVFMDIFYTFLQQGRSPQQALQQTQRVLATGNFAPLGQGRARIERNVRNRIPRAIAEYLSHPYYWAPFLAIGD